MTLDAQLMWAPVPLSVKHEVTTMWPRRAALTLAHSPLVNDTHRSGGDTGRLRERETVREWSPAAMGVPRGQTGHCILG